MTLAQVWDAFARAEREEGLMDWRVAGVYVWPAMKTRLLRQFNESLGLIDETDKQPSVFDIENPKDANTHLVAPAKTQVAVVPFVRRDKNGNDPFTDPIVEALRAAGQEPLVFGVGVHDDGTDRPSLERLIKHLTAKHRKRAIVRVLPTALFGGKHKRRWAALVARLEAETGGKAGRFKAFPRWLLVEFLAQEHGFRKYFDAAGITNVFMTNAYRRSLISAAQYKGRGWVIELQHGLISNRHPELAWPNTPWPAYVPDEFWGWGRYWLENSDLADGMDTRVIGAPANVARLMRQATVKLPDSVLVISQPEQAQKLLEATIALAIAHPELNFSIKPHPKEVEPPQAPELPANLKILSGKDHALQLIAAAETVLGVYSTALVEALALRCRVGVFNLPGIEHIEPIISRGDAKLLKSPKDFDALMAQPLPVDNSTANYYYDEPVDLNAMIKEMYV